MARTKRKSTWDARALLPAGEWVRGVALVDDLEVTLDLEDANDRLELYDWSDAETLPYDLAAIRHEADIRGFVRKWGLLGTTGSASDQTWPEPLSDWFKAALDMNFVLYLYAISNKASRGDLETASAVAEFFSGFYSGAIYAQRAKWLTKPSEREKLSGKHFDVVALRQDDSNLEYMVDEIREILEEEMWDGLTETSELSIRRLSSLSDDGAFDGTTPPPGDFILEVKCQDLLTRAYVQVALEMTSGVPVEVCPEDGRIFAVRDPRQKYCSPQCAGRARYRRFADQKRQAAS